MEAERCADCGHLLPDRAPTSPEVRRCQDCWWAEQRRAHAAGEPVHPMAASLVISRPREHAQEADGSTP